jgi:hypothetical protein
MRGEEFFRIPVADLAGHSHSECAYIKAADGADAGFFGQNAIPKAVYPFTDAGDRTEAGNDATTLPVFV